MPPPELMARVRAFTIAFFVLVAAGLVTSVVIPLVVPGPKLFTITLGSAVFILVIVVGGKLLRRLLVRGGRSP